MKIRLNFKKIFVYIFGFILLYQPNYPVNINLLLFNVKLNNHLLLISGTVIYLIMYIMRGKNIFYFFRDKKIFKFTTFVALSSVYYVCRTVLAGTSFFDIKNIRIVQNLFPILYLIAALIINNELNELGMTNKEKVKYVINLALFQAIIAISMLLLPSLKKIAIYIYSQGSENVNIYIAKNRLHGICDGDYTYSFQILHGIIALVCLIYAFIHNEKKCYIYTLPILLVTFLNGRSGIIIFIAGVLLFILVLAIHSHNLKKLFKFAIIIIIMTFCLYKVISLYIPSAVSLVRHAILDVTSFSDGNKETETSQLYNMIRFPKGTDFIFGRGFRVYGQKGILYGETFYSDIGIVNDMYMGGIIYCSLLYSAYLFLYGKRKENDLFKRSVRIIMLVSLILANIKGEVFRSALLQTITIFIAVVLSYDKSLNNYEERK